MSIVKFYEVKGEPVKGVHFVVTELEDRRGKTEF